MNLTRRIIGLAAALAILPAACGEGDAPYDAPAPTHGPGTGSDDPGSTREEATSRPPAFLLQKWIFLAGTAARTWDFNAANHGGVYGVRADNWRRLGTLDWRNETYAFYNFTATDRLIVMKEATGRVSRWTIVATDRTSMTVEDSYGDRMRLYTCGANVWPAPIAAAVCHR